MKWQQHSYDQLNRLQWSREVLDGGSEQWRQTFVYDRYGNRTIDPAQSSGGVNEKEFTVDTGTNRLGVPNGQTGVMQYDAAGNLTNDTYTGAGNRTYDAENKIVSAMGGIQTSQAQLYAYDASGNRIKRTVDGVETWQVYGLGNELLAEYAASGAVNNPQKEYGYRNGKLLVTATPRINVAATANGGMAIASQTQSPSYAASGAINGDRKLYTNNAWANSSTTFPQWLQVNFNGSKTITEIDVFSVQNNPTSPVEPTQSLTFSAYGVTAFQAQYWNGSTWVTISGGSITGNNNIWKQITFAPITTSGIRILISGTSDNYSRLTEVEAWADGVGGGNPRVEWLVADQLGTPRMILDESGNLASVKRHDYLPFGEELTTGISGRSTTQGYGGGDQVRQQFTQQQRDNETGLDYFGARYYGSVQGRFTGVDPVMSSAITELPQSWNRYTYVMNSPLVLIDPTGELWIAADEKGTQYNWVDKCPEGGTCYESIAVANESSVLIYGSKSQDDLTWALVNEYGVVDVAALASHPDSQFESASGPTYDPETYLSTTNAAALFNVARMYHDAHQQDAKLVFTGASNSKGQSALDANGAPIHGTHRNGENLDMRYMDTNGQPIKASNASSLADPQRMATLWGAFQSQTSGLANVYTGDQKRFGLPAISKKLEQQHRNHFHLYPKK